MTNSCPHQRWHYCRRIIANYPNFGAQCLDCLSMVKLERHGGKLLIKADEIPENAPIHPWIDPDASTGHGGLFND